MAKITSALIFIWTGTNAAIPAGWTRVTALDGLFTRVINTGDTVGDTGGSATHTHTSSSHTHTLAAHTHTFTLPNGSGYSTGDGNGGGGSQPGVTRAHNHGTTTSGAHANSSTSSVGVTYSSYSNNPPYYEVIFISPTGDVSGIPDGVVSLMHGTSLGSLTLCDGASSTPNLLGKFLRGAATSGDAGGTGGSSTNTHTIDHTHTNTHDHTAATTAAANANVSVNTGGNLARNGHTHSVGLNTCSTITSDNNSSIGAQSETVLPPYIDILIGQNKTGSNLLQLDMLAIYLGDEGDIPTGWSVYTKHAKLIRGANTTDAGNTGGAETHTHAAQSHTHTTPSHTHDTSSVSHVANVRDSSGGTAYADIGTTHAATTSSGTTPSLESSNTSADSANNMPEYKNVLLVKLTALSTDYTKEFTENISLTESISKNITRTLSSIINTTETISKSTSRVFSEVHNLIEAITSSLGRGKVFSEDVSTNENIQRGVGKSNTEDINTTESYLRSFTRSFLDNINTFESAIKKDITRVLQSVINVSETIGKGYIRVLSSIIDVTEVFSYIATKSRTFSENISLVETLGRIFDKFGDTFNWIRALFGDHDPKAITQLDAPTIDNDNNKPLMSSSNEKPDGFIVEEDRPSL